MLSDAQRVPNENGNAGDKAKAALCLFVSDAVNDAWVKEKPIEYHRGRTPQRDQQYDEHFTEIGSFTTCVGCVEILPDVIAHYSPQFAKNLVLQFLYTYFDTSHPIEFDQTRFDKVWAFFRLELSTPEWRHLGFTILQNFISTLNTIEIADGISICRRTLEDVQGLIGQVELDQLKRDWKQGAVGSHALIVEYREPKTQANSIKTDNFHTFNALQRGLLALRLAKAGDVRPGRLFTSRLAAFPARLRGGYSGSASWRPGSEYVLDETDLDPLRSKYATLVRFEQAQAHVWKNVGVALRRFSAVYDSDWDQHEDRVIDAVIAIEALLGTDQEITYRLATRVSGLLANDDDERVALYKAMKLYYDTRSKIVHGGELKDRNRAVLENSSSLIDVVRRLLCGFLYLTTGSTRFKTRKTFSDDLDDILLHSSSRGDLRREMGLA